MRLVACLTLCLTAILANAAQCLENSVARWTAQLNCRSNSDESGSLLPVLPTEGPHSK